MSIRPFLCLVLISVAQTFALAGQFTTVLGGAYRPTISAIATDSAGNTYVVGHKIIRAAPSGRQRGHHRWPAYLESCSGRIRRRPRRTRHPILGGSCHA